MRHQVAGGGDGVAVLGGIDDVVAGVTLQLLQFKIHFGMGSAMGKWNCYTVTVTQGVTNLNGRFGVNGIVATVALARGVPTPLKSPFGVAAGALMGANLERS